MNITSHEQFNEVLIQKTLELDRAHLLEVLKAGEVTVHFINSSGEKTIMRCTLKPDLLPVQEPKIQTQDLKETLSDQNLIKVYALDRLGWRSFKLERVSRVHAHIQTPV